MSYVARSVPLAERSGRKIPGDGLLFRANGPNPAELFEGRKMPESGRIHLVRQTKGQPNRPTRKQGTGGQAARLSVLDVWCGR
jgi:hypothetical protein